MHDDRVADLGVERRPRDRGGASGAAKPRHLLVYEGAVDTRARDGASVPLVAPGGEGTMSHSASRASISTRASVAARLRLRGGEGELLGRAGPRRAGRGGRPQERHAARCETAVMRHLQHTDRRRLGVSRHLPSTALPMSPVSSTDTSRQLQSSMTESSFRTFCRSQSAGGG